MKSKNYWSTPEAVYSYIAQRKNLDPNNSPEQLVVQWIDRAIANGLSLNPGLLVDVGIGPGIGAGNLIQKYGFKQLLAIDISNAMLDTVPFYVDLDKVHTTFQADDASKCRFNAQDKSADLVISIATVSLLETIENFFAEIARVLKPGGLFGFNTFVHMEHDQGVRYCELSTNPMRTYAPSKYSVVQYIKMHGFSLLMAGSSEPMHDLASIPIYQNVLLLKKN